MTACSENEVYPIPDQPPDTEIVGSPAENAITNYRVELHWTGNDSDGVVDHFQWRISDNGPDGTLDVADTLGLMWHDTVAWDSTFVVSADLDTLVPGSIEPILAKRSHTFFVRAIDDQGMADPTPAQLSFTAITWTPEIHFDLPPFPSGNACLSTSASLSFGWEASDADGPGELPTQCRYALVDVSRLDPVKLADAGLTPLPTGACLTDTELEELNPVSYFPDDAWSPWMDYEENDTTTVDAQVDSLPIASSWFLAVQAKDEAGAVTPVFSKRNKNLLHFKVREDKTPLIRLTADHMDGCLNLKDPVNELQREVFAGDVIGIQWEASAYPYRGIITGCRWGWDVADPSDPDDPGWAGPWGVSTHTPPREIPPGITSFTLLAKDDSGNQTQVSLQLEGKDSFSASLRPVLLVEDYDIDDGRPSSHERQEQWSAIWDRVLATQLPGYDPAIDHIVIRSGGTGPTLQSLIPYANVIWTLFGYDTGNWFSREVGVSAPAFHYNWLWAHQRLRGGLLLSGPAAAEATLSISPGFLFLPVDLSKPYTTPYDLPPIDLSHSWPHQAWGVTVIDRVSGVKLSNPHQEVSYACDGLVLAHASDAAIAMGIGDLRPAPARISPTIDPNVYSRLFWEEFYDRDLSEGVDIASPGLTEALFRWEALRDSPWMDSSLDCPPPSPEGLSYLDGAATGIYRLSTPLLRPSAASAQILWGFHPLAFDEDDLSLALRGIFGQLWGLELR